MPPHCRTVRPRNRSPLNRKNNEKCSKTSGTNIKVEYKTARPSTAGKIIGMCPKIMDMTNPTNTAWSIAS